jgi:hypothetical protein
VGFREGVITAKTFTKAIAGFNQEHDDREARMNAKWLGGGWYRVRIPWRGLSLSVSARLVPRQDAALHGGETLTCASP